MQSTLYKSSIMLMIWGYLIIFIFLILYAVGITETVFLILGSFGLVIGVIFNMASFLLE